MISTDSTLLDQRMTVFDEAAAYALGALKEVSAGTLDWPTPCDEWRVRDVVLHLADVCDAVIDLIRTGDLVLPPPRARDTVRPVAVAQERIRALREAAVGAADRGTAIEPLLDALRAAANEFAAHGGDIATALDMKRPIPDATATALLALAEERLTAANRGDKFAAPVSIAVDASPSDRFAAYLGRRPRALTAGG